MAGEIPWVNPPQGPRDTSGIGRALENSSSGPGRSSGAGQDGEVWENWSVREGLGCPRLRTCVLLAGPAPGAAAPPLQSHWGLPGTSHCRRSLILTGTRQNSVQGNGKLRNRTGDEKVAKLQGLPGTDSPNDPRNCL